MIDGKLKFRDWFRNKSVTCQTFLLAFGPNVSQCGRNDIDETDENRTAEAETLPRVEQTSSGWGLSYSELWAM